MRREGRRLTTAGTTSSKRGLRSRQQGHLALQLQLLLLLLLLLQYHATRLLSSQAGRT